MEKYKYYKFVHLDTTLPIYACDGTDEAQTAFRADAEALGMQVCIIVINGKSLSFAADILDNGDHAIALDRAKAWFRQLNRVPLKTGHNKLNGPIPQKREFTVYTVWQCWGHEIISLKPGQTLQEALNDYIENAALPDDGEYVDSSHEIDYATGFCND